MITTAVDIWIFLGHFSETIRLDISSEWSDSTDDSHEMQSLIFSEQ